MAVKHHSYKTSSFIRCLTIVITISLLITSSYYYFYISPFIIFPEPFSLPEKTPFTGDLRDSRIPWNSLCFGPALESLRIAAFSKKWPIGAAPGGMERHAYTLYTSLAAKGHEVHVFTVPSDTSNQPDIHQGKLNVYFVANKNGSLDSSSALDIFNKMNDDKPFDYVHTESVSLPHWHVKMVPNSNVAATWHGFWYEIMHSKLFEELVLHDKNVKNLEDVSNKELREAMVRLVHEIRFFSSYKNHICISDSASEVLVKIYQLPRKNVHVILNGVDETNFVYSPNSGSKFREKHGVPCNASLVLGVAGRLVKDKGHPLLHEAFSSIIKYNPNVYLLVAGSGPWEKRYAALGKNVKVLGALEPHELSGFYNAIDVFVNPTLRPQGLDLTLIEAMHCGKPVLAPNYPSIVGTLVLNENYGYTFSPNVRSFVEALELVIKDGTRVLQKKGMACKTYVGSMFTATKMASAYERFFLCMKNDKYCHYPLPQDC